jgi:hypothetical protein
MYHENPFYHKGVVSRRQPVENGERKRLNAFLKISDNLKLQK